MALPSEPKEGEKARETSDDKDFDPTPEALVDEIDDERTLDEEEAIDGNNQAAVQEELDDLKKESEMPIEELLAYYERMRSQAEGPRGESDEEEEDDDEEEEDDDEDEDDEDDVDEEEKHDRKDGSSGSGTKRTSSDDQQITKKPSLDSQHQLKGDKSTSSSRETTQSTPSKQRTNNITLEDDSDQNRQTTDTRIIEQQDSSRTQNELTQGFQCNLVERSDSNRPETTSTTTNLRDLPERQKHQSLTNFMLDQDPTTMFQTLLNYDLDDSEDDDYSYSDDENGDYERDWRRSIHVGPDYQAEIPEGLCEYGDLPPYQTEDKLIWKNNPNLTDEQILEYLKESSAISQRNDVSISPASVPKFSVDSMRVYIDKLGTDSALANHGVHENQEKYPPNAFPDVYMSQSRKRTQIDIELEQENYVEPNTDSKEENSDSTSQDNRYGPSTEEYFQNEEQLLYLLLQCNYNIDEALRRRKLDPFKYYFHEPMSLWSQDECLGFEHGLRVHGKDFRQIRENKVQTRTHAELVAFYYLWKKSERHDVYTNQYKLDRKRCLTHPGTTDYMDEFIEDNESNLNRSSKSPTPALTDGSVSASFNIDTIVDSGHATPSFLMSESRSPQVQSIEISQSSTIQKNLFHSHQNSREDDADQRSSIYIDNTALP